MSNNSKFCSHCGVSVKEDDVFCNNCGASLDEIVEPIASTPISQYQPYNQPVYTQPKAVFAPKPKSLDAVAYLSLGFGLVAVLFSLIPINIGFFIISSSVIAIVTGSISIPKTQKKYRAIAGIVLGAIGIILYIMSWFGLSLWQLI